MGLYDGTFGGNPHRTILNEAGLYKLILRANKTRPAAALFQRWVTHEVLPSIRKTGGFQLQPGETIPLPANFTDALRQHAATLIKLAEEQEAHAKTQAERDAARAAKEQAQAEVSRLAPMVAAVGKHQHKVGQFAATLQGVNSQRIKASLRDLGFLYQKDGRYRRHMATVARRRERSTRGRQRASTRCRRRHRAGGGQ
jgi:prophage antirepressor-like protein